MGHLLTRPEPPRRRSGPAYRFHLWHAMAASAVLALGWWMVATFDPILWLIPVVLGLGMVGQFLVILLIYLAGAILAGIAGSSRRSPAGGQPVIEIAPPGPGQVDPLQ